MPPPVAKSRLLKSVRNVEHEGLYHWIATRKIAAPRVKLLKGKAVRLWSQAQIEKARELKWTLKPGPKKKK
jgi:hypothetical protein